MRKRNLAGSRSIGRLAMAGVAGLGAAGLTAGLSGVAGAATTQQVQATLDFACTVTTTPSTVTVNATLPVQLTITTPATITAGQQFTASTVSVVTLPSAILQAQAFLGFTSLQINSISAGVTGTDVTPASASVSGLGLPVTITNLSNPITTDLSPVTFTANSAGTATFTAANTLTVVSTLIGGTSANGYTATMTCTAPTNATIGSLTIGSSGTIPVGAVGGAGLAGLVAVGGAGIYAVRRRRHPLAVSSES